MHLFRITNFFSILTAETIIKQKKLKGTIAYIIDLDNNENYCQILKKIMNPSLWEKIKIEPIKVLNSRKKNIICRFIKVSSKLFKVSKDFKILEQSLKEDKVSQIYLSLIFSSEEKILYHISQRLNIKVNFYEEAPTLYMQDLIEDLSKKTNYYKRLLLTSKWLYLLIPKRIRCFFYNLYNFEYYKAENVYCCFPEKYNSNNFNNKIKIDLDFNLSPEEIKVLENFKADILFLSRPVSEDEFLSQEEEMKILELFLNTHNSKNIFVKFHPRESRSKIDIVKEKFNIKEVSDEYKNIPAEKLVLFGKINCLVGYETSTLAYASELSNTVVYSLLNKIYYKSTYHELFYKFYKDSFKKIKYFDT